MALTRKPFQGVFNIVRFNWHFYLFVLVVIIAATIGYKHFNPIFQAITLGIASLAFFTSLISLLVSYYVYDGSSLYQLKWLDNHLGIQSKNAINISAGFDETTSLIRLKFPEITLTSCDFYDPKKHTEVSIKRARKVYPPSKGLIPINTNSLPFDEHTFDHSLLIFAAHEIRDSKERIIFFKELNRITAQEGTIVVTEHLRDLNNFLAYNLGFIHFLSRKSWLETFNESGLMIIEEIKINPFVSTFILKSNGNSN